MKVDTGIPEEARKKVAEGVAKLLAETYVLYVKTQGYHWNVEGPMFRSLHMMFEEQYEELRDAVDEIAERSLALGFRAPGSLGEFVKLSGVKDEEGAPEAKEMIRKLVEANEKVIKTARDLVKMAEEVEDVATADLATQRINSHEKTSWMLRSMAA